LRKPAGSLAVAALLLLSPVARAQLNEVEATGFRHAFVDPTSGKRTALLAGGSVTNISNEELLISNGVRLQFFDDNGRTNLDVTSPSCTCNLRKDLVHSTNRLQATSGSGQFSLDGEGFEYLGTNGSLTISNSVHAIIRKDLIQASPASPAAPVAVQPSRQPAATPTTNEFVHIFSDHMRYLTNIAVFADSVRVDDSQGKMTCGMLTVTFTVPSRSDEKRQVDNILAEQHVVIDSNEMHATGDQATYRQAADVVELTGNTTWQLRQYEGRAEEVIVNRTTRAFRALRNTEMTLPPGAIGRNDFLLPENPPAPHVVSSEGQPVRVRAGEFEFKPDLENTNFNLGVFRDDVRVSGEKGNLNCELMTIRSTAQSNRTESVVTERAVVMEQGDRRVTGDKAIYTAATDTVEITGQPAWMMGQRKGTADILAFNLRDKSYRATGNVRMRLPPESFGRTPWLLPKSPAASDSFASSSVTTPNPSALPIEVSSDAFEFRPDALKTNLNLAIYSGDVRASEPDRMKLSCEFLTVTARMSAGTNQVESVAAERNVDLEIHESNAERCAHGDTAVYTADNGEVALTANEGVDLAFVDPRISGSGRGAKAVYAAGEDILKLTGNDSLTPVVTTPEGQLSGDVLILDHAKTTLTATGNWKMTLNSEALKKKMASSTPGL
jgi:lipopolysaccharide export system protein LptA